MLPLPLLFSELSQPSPNLSYVTKSSRIQVKIGLGVVSMSKKQTEIEKIRDIIRHFHLAQETGDEKAFLNVWHSEAKRFGVGPNNELYVLTTEDILRDQFYEIQKGQQENPDYSVHFFIKQMKFFDVQPDNLIASVLVEWQMLILGKCVGFHYTYYHLVKTEGNWIIVNATDRARIPS